MALYRLSNAVPEPLRKEILDTIYNGETTILQFNFPEKSIMQFMNGIVANMLGHVDLIFLLDTFITILRESLLNAVKANAKRLYFEKNKTDINDNLSYTFLMKKFRAEIIGDMAAIESELKDSSYYVTIEITVTPTIISMAIRNNSPILPKEHERVTQRITRAWEFRDFSEAYDTMYDETEGAGLGIILSVLLLKNLGVKQNDYRIECDGKITSVILAVPRKIKQEEIVTEVKNKILREIELLPTFPNNIVDLQMMCENPDSSISVIADKIKSDPSLTADILKLSNSAGFITQRRVDNINDALMRIGLTNLKYILIAASTRKIMDKRYKQFEKIWNHCLQVASFGKSICTKCNMKRIADQVFITALLHDLGKIVLLSVDLELTNWIADFVMHRGIRSTTILEEVAIGISHSSIGKIVAQKWNFSEFMLEGIALHHAPLQSSPQYRDIVFITYLANIFVGVAAKKYSLDHADPTVLEALGIAPDSLEDLLNYCRTNYQLTN